MLSIHAILLLIGLAFGSSYWQSCSNAANGLNGDDTGNAPPPVAILKGSGGATAEFSADGKVLLAAGGNSARLWDATTFRPLTPPLTQPGKINVARLSQDGSKVLTAGADGSACVWDLRTGKRVCQVKHSCAIVAGAFDPAGTRIVTGGDKDKTAAVWDVATGRLLYLLGLTGTADAVGFSPVGDRVMTLSASMLTIFDSATGHPLISANEHDWDDVKQRAVFSKDGRFILFSGWRAVIVLNAASLQEVSSADALSPGDAGHVTAIALSPDSRRFAASSLFGEVHLWDVATGKASTRTLSTDSVDELTNLAFSADGKTLFAAGRDSSNLNVWAAWDVRSGTRFKLVRYGRGAQGAISPDGTLIAAGGKESGDTAIWRIGQSNH
jgi:WD40 repeat protein